MYCVKTLRAAGMFLLAALLLTAAFAAPVSAAPDSNYLVLYMVGTDLESGTAPFASENLINLVSNWGTDTGDILLIYGGSNKAGWNDGYAITNLDLLRQDLADGSLGTDNGNSPTQYVLERVKGDISTESSLAYALQYAETYQTEKGLTQSHKYILFWNHGGGYNGFGWNELTNKVLSIDDMASAFSKSGGHYNVIAFDACLMASLEVADKLSPYADYLLASEENIPGDGYNYEDFAKAVAANPEMSPVEFGKNVILAYNAASGPTLSLVDLSKTRDVVSAMNGFGSELKTVLSDKDSLSVIGQVLSETQGFGIDKTGASSAVSLDLAQFIAGIYDAAVKGSTLETSAKTLLTSIGNYVIYTSDNGRYSAANGVTFAAPKEKFKDNIPDSVALGREGWYQFLSEYLSAASNNPSIAAVYKTIPTENTRSINVTSAGSGYSLVLGDYLYFDETYGDYIVIGEVPLQPSTSVSSGGIWNSVPTGEYEDPDWDGAWFILHCCDENVSLPVSMLYNYEFTDRKTNHLTYVYSISGNYTRTLNGTEVTRDSVIYAVVDMETKTITNLRVESYDALDYNSRFSFWEDSRVLAGDIFTPQYTIYDEEKDVIYETAADTSFEFTHDGINHFVYRELPEDNCFWLAVAADFLDEEHTVYLELPGLPVQKPAKSPAPIAGIAAALGCIAAAVIIRRK